MNTPDKVDLKPVLARKRDEFLLIALSMLFGALVVCLFIFFETLVIIVIEWSVSLRSAPVKERLEPVLDEVSFWSGVVILLVYGSYVAREVYDQLRRSMKR